MPKRKQANLPGAPRGRFRDGGSRKATEIILESQPDPVPPEPSEILSEEPDPGAVNIRLPAVSEDVRLPENLVHELRLRSTERQSTGTEPWTHQGIVAEALRDWLSNPKNM